MLASGCVMAVDDMEDIDDEEAALTSVRGVDYAWTHPSPSALHADGYEFVARYLSHDSGKNITESEARSLLHHGLTIVLVWESTATSVLGGHAQGVADARAARAQARAVGQPPDRPIYFAIDFDAQPSQQSVINAYFDGVASVIGRDRTGAYAGYGPIHRLFDAHKIRWAWQTYAWSYGDWDRRAQLRQVQNSIMGGCCDLDRSEAVDFGQWPAPQRWNGDLIASSYSRVVHLAPGQVAHGYFRLRNTGRRTWNPHHVFLETTTSGASPIASPSWIDRRRAAAINRTVHPGETGRFTFRVRAPIHPGTYRQHFRPRHDRDWFHHPGVRGLRVVVRSACPDHATQWICYDDSRVRCSADGTVEHERCPSGCRDGVCDAPPLDGGMCRELTQSCTSGDECCLPLSCERSAAGGRACCSIARQACTSDAECCGTMRCSGGACACRAEGQSCLNALDCCAPAVCNGGVCTSG